jgi:Ca-activated chloride channel family protein
MARNTGEVGGSLRRRLFPIISPNLQAGRKVSNPVGKNHRADRLLGILLIFVVAGVGIAFAQSQTTDQVHIAPQVDPNHSVGANVGAPDQAAMIPGGSASPDVNPTLKTHTRPITRDVDLVLVPVTITDPMNRLVTGLEQDNFEVYEGTEKQAIKHFSSEDVPISLGVIFDVSGSMSNKIEKSREAVVEFFRTANPQDEFFMVSFSDKPELLSDFTSSVEDIQAKLVYVQPKGRTALMDAIYMGLHQMKKAHHEKKALLIISDGGDNHSRYTQSEIKSMVKEADVQIYGIGIFDNSPTTQEEKMGPITLSDITDVTGGRTFTIDNPNELADVATKIGIELRNQYVLGYRPTKPARDGKWRKIKVKLLPPKGLPPLHVYAKTGYYAPSE